MDHTAQKALIWTMIDVLGSQVSPFVAFLIIARFIDPHDYGTFALAMSCLAPLTVVLYQGLADALITAIDPDEAYIATAFWMNMGLALVITAIVQVIAGSLAELFRAPVMEPALRWLSLLAVLQGLVSVHVALYRRRLEMGVLARRTLIGRALGAALGIGLAVAGFGIWALVAMQLIQSAVAAAILWGVSDWRPKLCFNVQHCRDVLRFGTHFTSASLATAVVNIADNLIVGFFFDPKAVGLYVLAARILEMATTVVLVPMRSLVMPLLSKAASDPPLFASSYRGMVTPAFLAWMPIILILATTSRILIPGIFGPKWEGAVVVLHAMCATAFTTPLWFFAGQALSAAGRPDGFLKLAMIQIGVTSACVSFASQLSLAAVGWGWACASAVMVPIALWYLNRRCEVSWLPMARDAAKLGSAGLALLTASLWTSAMAHAAGFSAWIGAALGAAAGLLVYVALIEFVLTRGQISAAVRGLAALAQRRAPHISPRQA
ncbi:lipopolysaccharide biosynthesis protein [Alsobacter sp. KACC 23698]|uniref:Lipopolysaccharide biosynthesis protein n=1 Tax=Alsobacter sp. KACC 23698 TaxID=3149229 RepID=A0AAU7JJ32_9HYPH